jgi:SAM-dependent methyltransferase
MAFDNRAIARALAQKAWAENRPLAWFEELYQKAEHEGAPIPWGDLAPNPNLLALYERCQEISFGPRALKVGCGLGDDAEWLAEQGFKVTAFDIAPTAIAMCRRRFPHSKVAYSVADLFSPPPSWKGAFDLVLESYTLQAMPRSLRHEAIKCICACVAPGGHLLLITHARKESEPEGTLPWPLVRSELKVFAEFGLQVMFFEDVMDPADATTRHFRVCYRRT